MDIFGFLHAFEMFMLMSYLIWRQLIPLSQMQVADTVYLFALYILVLSWLTYSDECIISLVYKKLNGKEDLPSTLDLQMLFGDVYIIYNNIYYICIYITALYLFLKYDLVLPGIAFLLSMYIYVYWTRYDVNNERLMDKRELEFLGIKGITLLATVYAIYTTTLLCKR